MFRCPLKMKCVRSNRALVFIILIQYGHVAEKSNPLHSGTSDVFIPLIAH